MNVVIVECREPRAGRLESDVAYVSKTWESAIAWMQTNSDWCNAHVWWWAAYEHEVDGDNMAGVPRFFDRTGAELRDQPVRPPVEHESIKR